MANILIIGCGDTGGRAGVLLAQAGHAVWGVRRSPFALPGVTALRADITRPFTLDIPPPDLVYILLSPDGPDEAGYARTFLDGIERIGAALAPFRPRRVFFVSSTSVYGEAHGEWVDENTPPAPARFNGRILREAEQRAGALWPTTVVRFGGIYGEGRERLLRWVREGRPVTPGQWTNRIHVQDAARVLAFLGERVLAGDAVDRLYLGVDDAPALQEDVLDWLADAMGLPSVPRLPGAAGEANRRIRNSRIRDLGFAFLYPDYRAGYGALLAAARPAGDDHAAR